MAFNHPDPLGLEVELEVDSDDLSSLDDDLRPEFPPEGMTCPVEACGSYVYISRNSLWSHWKKSHRRSVRVFQCGQKKCRLTFAFRHQLKRHLIKSHKLNEKAATDYLITAKNFTKPNPKFIDPGDVKCPKRKFVLHEAERAVEAGKRRAEPVLEDRSEWVEHAEGRTMNHVCRDEEIRTRITSEGCKIRMKNVKPHWMRK